MAQLQLSRNCSFTANTPNYLYLLQYLMLSYYHTVLSYEHIDHKIECRNPQVRGKELYPDSRHTIIWSSAVNKWITKNRSQKSTSPWKGRRTVSRHTIIWTLSCEQRHHKLDHRNPQVIFSRTSSHVALLIHEALRKFSLQCVFKPGLRLRQERRTGSDHKKAKLPLV